MRLGHAEIFVSDPIKSMSFYTDILGFQLEGIKHRQFVWLRKEGHSFLLRPGRKSPNIENYQQTPMSIVLYTENLKQSIDDLQSHGVEIKGCDGSHDCPTFTDPDGNWFQLVNPNKV